MKHTLLLGVASIILGCASAGTSAPNSKNDVGNTDAVDGTDSADGQDGAQGTDGLDAQDGTDATDAQSTSDGNDGVDGIDAADGTDGSNSADGTDGADTADAVDGQLEKTGGVTGRLIKVDGSPVTNASVLVCADFCVVADLDDNGEYLVEELPPGQYKIRATASSQGLMNMEFPQTVAADEIALLTRDVVMIDAVEDAIEWPVDTGGEIALAKGQLLLTADAGDLKYPLGMTEAAHAAFVKTEYLPPYQTEPWSGLDSATYAFHINPDGIEATLGISFVVKDTEANKDDKYAVYTVNASTGLLEEVGTATGDENGQILSDTDTRIKVLATLILIQTKAATPKDPPIEPPKDSDNDGMSDADEAKAGTDPQKADTDGDGINDGIEAETGTDPIKPDTDSDGYTDGQEAHAGTDPLDPKSVIYTGGWPYNTTKDDYDDPGILTPASLGNRIARWKALDQFGQVVDIYDFMAADTPIVLDIGTKFCKPCKGVAAWLSTGNPGAESPETDGPVNTYAWWKDSYAKIYDMIQNGDILWVTVLWSSCKMESTKAKPEDVVWWDQQWPNEHIPVLVDPDCSFKEHMQVNAMPHISVLNSKLELLVHGKGPTPGFKYLSEL